MPSSGRDGPGELELVVSASASRTPADYIPVQSIRTLEAVLYLRLLSQDEGKASGSASSPRIVVRQSIWPNHPVAEYLPALRDEKEWVPACDVLSHIAARGRDIDARFGPAERAQVRAFRAMVTEKLYPAALCLAWTDSKNYTVTRGAFASKAPWILQTYIPWSRRRSITAYLKEANYNNVDTAVRRAMDCLGSLDRFFGGTLSTPRQYLFGSRPSSADATLTGFLAFVFETKRPNPKLRLMITKHFPKFVTYYRFVMAQAFGRSFQPVSHPDARPSADAKKDDNIWRLFNGTDKKQRRKGLIPMTAQTFTLSLIGLAALRIAIARYQKGTNEGNGSS